MKDEVVERCKSMLHNARAAKVDAMLAQTRLKEGRKAAADNMAVALATRLEFLDNISVVSVGHRGITFLICSPASWRADRVAQAFVRLEFKGNGSPDRTLLASISVEADQKGVLLRGLDLLNSAEEAIEYLTAVVCNIIDPASALPPLFGVELPTPIVR